jgi:hypothetical protein
MGLFRKLKNLGSLHLLKENNARTPPNNRRRMRDQAAPLNINYDQLPRSFFSAVDLARQDAGYDPLPVFAREPIPSREENFMFENPETEFLAFDRSRSKSRERPLDRSARSHSRGTPVKFRRRPISPELLQPNASSPFLFHQNSVPGSPDMQRRFQHPQQQQQFDMMMGQQPVQFLPQFQQPFYPMINPNVNMQPWFMMQQPQMYPFF